MGGFGRGGNGAPGPFTPVEQAWLAQAFASLHRRGPVHSLNAAVGFFGNAPAPRSGRSLRAIPGLDRMSAAVHDWAAPKDYHG